MANNTTLPAGSGGDTIRNIDKAGVKTQVIAIDIGGAGAESLFTTALTDGTNPANETLVDRLKVAAALRLLDTSQAATGQLVAAKGDQTTGLWANIRGVGSVAVNAFPAGFMRVTDEPHQIFYDPFDSFDTTDRWNGGVAVGGGVAPAVVAGVLTIGSGTTASGYASLTSRPTFTPTIPAWLSNSWAVKIEAGATAGNNATRFWGIGQTGGTPTTAQPLGPTGDGYGFEIDTAGVLQAVVYATGVRTVVSSLATLQPTDGAFHRYICFYRTDRIFWYIDTLASTGLGATSNFQGPAIQTLPLVAVSVAGATPPAASRVFTCSGLAVSDTGKNNTTLSDGTFGWRKATIKPGVVSVAGDNALVVTLHPSSAPLTAQTVSQATPANLQATVTQQTLTKATQGATGVTTQDLKDAGRSSRTITLDSFAVAATTETLNTMSYSTDNGTPTTGTSYTVTAAKRFRIQAITLALHTIAGNTVAVGVIVRIRVNNGGAAIVTSPMQFIAVIPGVASANGGSQAVSIPIPDGYELVAGAGLGVTTTCAGFVATTNAPKVNVTIMGYEY